MTFIDLFIDVDLSYLIFIIDPCYFGICDGSQAGRARRNLIPPGRMGGNAHPHFQVTFGSSTTKKVGPEPIKWSKKTRSLINLISTSVYKLIFSGIY